MSNNISNDFDQLLDLLIQEEVLTPEQIFGRLCEQMPDLSVQEQAAVMAQILEEIPPSYYETDDGALMENLAGKIDPLGKIRPVIEQLVVIAGEAYPYFMRRKSS